VKSEHVLLLIMAATIGMALAVDDWPQVLACALVVMQTLRVIRLEQRLKEAVS
jgi:hypothetical protein